ncbi:hypothetical protein [Chamaesiphon sp. VAR_48_metabat_403]|uniref:hypothetical protein n=1 Tax=Chamaesiphon sp. VAR_48_metabat_403 TaxID=2964700 RepID=UPI00286DB931|nr:hypothetical protein [Chamaesiphon sp. VAR_48_metabat_403]
MSEYQIFIDTILIGHSAFECGDPPMGVVSGNFLPMPAYGRFRSQFIALRESSQEHLPLSAARINGEVILSKGVSIFDCLTELEEIQVTVFGIAYPLYEELFPDFVLAYDRQYSIINNS